MKKLEQPRGLTINFSPSAKQYAVWQALQGNRCDHCGGTLEMKANGVDKNGHTIWTPTCSKCGNTDIPELILMGGSAGGGKQMSLDSHVCTPFGFRKVKDLQVGNIITDPLTGGMQRIIWLHPIEKHPYYRIHFIDGTYNECSEGHLWLCHESRTRSKKRIKYQTGLDKIWTTLSLYNWMEGKKKGMYKHNNLIIPLSEPIKFTPGNKKITIHPYILGAIIGDGCISNTLIDKGVVEFTTMDIEIRDRFIEQGYDMSHIHKKENNRALSYYIKDDNLMKEICKLGIAGNKSKDHFIPMKYKYASVEDRIQLMQGLIDTDGYVDSRGHIIYTSISKQLAEDVAWIVRSLGGVATITCHESKYKTKTGEHVRCNDHYDVYIRTKINPDLCGLKRKKERARYEYNSGASELGKRIVDIEYIGEREGRCITVENPSGLYVADNFTVTHNSYLGCAWVVSSCLKYPGVRMVLARKELKNLIATTWATMLDILAKWGLEQDINYHINNQRLVLTFWNGSSIVGLDLAPSPVDVDFNRLGSLEISGAFCDEVSEISEKAIEVLQSRIRYKIAESFIVGKCCCSTNPCLTWVRSTFVMDDDGNPAKLAPGLRYLPFSLFDNPDEKFRMVYYNRLSKIRDKATRDRLLNGNWEFTSETKMAVYHNFDGEKHLSAGLFESAYDKMRPLILSFDWNVNPYSSCLAFQFNYEQKIVYVIREFMGTPKEKLNNSPAFGRFIANEVKSWGHIGGIDITGDPAGLARSTQTEAGINNFTIIAKAFEAKGLNVNVKVFNTQPAQVRRVEFINELFTNLYGWRIIIDLRARRLAEDFSYQTKNPDGTKEKKKVLMEDGTRAEKYGHMSDCFDYALCYYLNNDFNRFINGDAEIITTSDSDDMYDSFSY